MIMQSDYDYIDRGKTKMKISIVVALAGLIFSACGNPVAHIAEFPRSDFVPASKIPGGAVVGGQYKLIPYDQISIRFPFHPEQDPKTSIPIQPDGNVVLDGVGAVKAAGMTPEELAKAIVQKTSDHLRDPQVSVTVVQYAPRRVFVGGEVRTPGTVNIQDGMTPLQAIFERGGFTTNAQTDGVVLIRDAASAEPQIGLIDLTQAMENGAAERLILAANDVIYVPMTGIGRSNLWVKQHIRDLIPWEVLRPPSIRDMVIP
jgi:protein involved in polysaccharide export with SLBB domain